MLLLDQSGAAAPEVGERGIWERQVGNLEALCRFGDLSCKTVRVYLALLAGPAIKNEKTGDGRRGVGGHTPSHHSEFPRPLVLGISRRGGPSQRSPFWELCEEIRGWTGSRLNEPSGGDNGADLTRGHRASPPAPLSCRVPLFLVGNPPESPTAAQPMGRPGRAGTLRR